MVPVAKVLLAPAVQRPPACDRRQIELYSISLWLMYSDGCFGTPAKQWISHYRSCIIHTHRMVPRTTRLLIGHEVVKVSTSTRS